MDKWQKAEQEANRLLKLCNSKQLVLDKPDSPSHAYQYLIVERLHPKLWNNTKTPGAVENGHLDLADRWFTRHARRYHTIAESVPEHIRQQIDDIEHQLCDLFWWMIDNLCTERQRQIVQMYYIGMTQIEVAESLNICQSSIVKTLSGSHQYGKQVNKKYGGVNNLLTKFLKQSAKCQDMMSQMEQVYRAEYHLRLPFYHTYKRVIGNSIQYHQWLKAQLDEREKAPTHSVMPEKG